MLIYARKFHLQASVLCNEEESWAQLDLMDIEAWIDVP